MTVAVSIVVVTHRGAGELVRACLASLATSADRDDSSTVVTIVVDNSAGPATAAADYGPNVDEVVRVDNRGFGAAANAGIRLARQRSDAPVAVLNDDIEVGPRLVVAAAPVTAPTTSVSALSNRHCCGTAPS